MPFPDSETPAFHTPLRLTDSAASANPMRFEFQERRDIG